MSEFVFYTTLQDKFKPNPFYVGDITAIKNYIELNREKDTYKSINHFSEPTSWKKDNIGTLVALVIDVEIMNHAFDITLEDAKQLLRHIEKEFDKVMPNPSKVIHSGRGIHIYFDIEDSKDLQKYQIVLSRLQKICDEVIGRYDALSQAKADTSVNYASLIRVEGTLNTKANAYSQRIYESKARYTLDNLIERYITDLSDIIGDSIKQRARVDKVHRSELKTFKRDFTGYRKGFTVQTYRKAVLDDLELLQKLRSTRIEKEKDGNYKLKGNKGDRNLMLFIYSVYAKYYYQDTNEAYRALKRFNKHNKPEPLEQDELNTIFNSSLKSEYLTMKPKNIATKLKLDEEEMQQMKMLFDAVEFKRRRKLSFKVYRGKQTQANVEAKRELVLKCKALKEQGYTQSRIAQELNISQPTVNRYLCK